MPSIQPTGTKTRQTQPTCPSTNAQVMNAMDAYSSQVYS